jgi:hypothetical protein
MQRSLRSNLSLPDNFEFPNFSRGRIQLNIMADAVAAAGAPVVAPTEAVLWQETPDHGNYNPGSKHGQSIFKRKTERKKNEPDSSSGKKATDSKASGDEKLTIAGRLKEVLCSRLMLSDEDADKVCSEVTGQVN